MSGSSRNVAMDKRLLRRVIAEDPEWNLETVAPLIELIIKHIVKNFHSTLTLQPPISLSAR